jgi:hypothetical protein
MSAALNFNGDSPKPVRLWREVTIGWEHDVQEGEIVYRTDENGNPIPKAYKIPSTVVGKDLIDRAQKLPHDRLKALQDGGIPGLFEISGMLVGDDVIEQIGTDPTVAPAAFFAFLESLVSGLDLAEIAGAEDPKD